LNTRLSKYITENSLKEKSKDYGSIIYPSVLPSVPSATKMTDVKTEAAGDGGGLWHRPRQSQQTQPDPIEQTESLTTRQAAASTTITRGRFRKRWKLPQDLTSSQEAVFLKMQLRKMNRALTGTKSRNRNYEFLALAFTLVIICSVGSLSRSDEATGQDLGWDDTFVSLTMAEVISIGIWLYVAAFVTQVSFAFDFILSCVILVCLYRPFNLTYIASYFESIDVQGKQIYRAFLFDNGILAAAGRDCVILVRLG